MLCVVCCVWGFPWQVGAGSAVPVEVNDLAGAATAVRAVLLPDLRADAERCEMTRALWERLHRAASGTFVC